ncbi:MAG TPA: hypothetical protein VK814_09885 [Acidobacteriaceae bacterium]|nr:hypothetical protein [Acidobacteriaceae bacterium]
MIRAFNAPIRSLPPALRVAAGLAAIICCLLYAMYGISHSESVFIAGDARFYIAMATGDYSQVMQPFASRQLGALFVTGLMHWLHCTVESGFLIEGTASAVFALVAIYYLALKTTAPRWFLFAVAFVPFWSFLLQDLVLPDLWYSALLALLLLLLQEDQMLAAAIMMFPLMLSRESTSLTLVCFLIAAWKRLRWTDRVVAVVLTLAGSVVVKHLAMRAQPNSENLPESIYMLAKVPWNFMNNVFGLVPWSNVNTQFCAVPRWTFPVHLGRVHAIGICGFSDTGWVLISEAVLSEFGLLPLLLGFLWWRSRKANPSSVLLRFALLYGTASLILAPMLGTWFARLIGYAWPIFFVALPLLFDRIPCKPTTLGRECAALGFFGAHMLLFSVAYRWFWITQLEVNLVIWAIGYFLLRYWLGTEAHPADRSRAQQDQSIELARERAVRLDLGNI